MTPKPVPCPDCSGTIRVSHEDGSLHDPTCPLGQAMTRIMDEDRTYFDNNPTHVYYDRDPNPAELAENRAVFGSAPFTHVRVMRFWADTRARLFCENPPPEATQVEVAQDLMQFQWQEVIDAVGDASKVSWSLLNGSTARIDDDGVLVVKVGSAALLVSCQQRGLDVIVQDAVEAVCGVSREVRFVA